MTCVVEGHHAKAHAATSRVRHLPRAPLRPRRCVPPPAQLLAPARGFVGESAQAPVAGEFHCHDFDHEDLRDAASARLAEQARERDRALREATAVAPPQPDAAWEAFHTTQNAGARFYKEKRYIPLAFPALRCGAQPLHVLEVGCGCGSTILPLLQANAGMTATAVDLSPAAVAATARVADGLGVDPGRLTALAADVSDGACAGRARLLDAGAGAHDAALMVFTLSAVPPAQMPDAVDAVAACVRPGGLVMVRDYGLWDMAQLRFHGRQLRDDGAYVRQEGTLATFFSVEQLGGLLRAAGLEERELEYHCVESRNRRRGTTLRRVFVHAVFQRPEL
ncbi:unnamed protein product [Pedinophyceae sp. YPF-701]|nr:unnamed protein product [Pedinophyceae sp. YPF-701]